MIAILLDPHEGREEWVGIDCPVGEAIAQRKYEKRRDLNGLRHREGRAEANGIEAGHDERTWAQSQKAEGCEHHVAAIHTWPRSRPLPEELGVEKREGGCLGQGVDT